MIPLSRRLFSRIALAYIPFCCFTTARLCHAAGTLAIVEAGVEQSEDTPFVRPGYEFLPGDYLYFTFQIAGFAVRSENRGETQKISLTYDVTPQDSTGVALTPPVSGTIDVELNSEDKDWLPKRSVSFLLPSFVPAADFRVHVHVNDTFGKNEISQDAPFRIGGVEIQPARTISVQNFQFFRSEQDQEPLRISAYSPGDAVFVRFYMTGFKTDPQKQNQYHLSYGLTVTRPDGKIFLDKPNASELQGDSFYPARYIPGVLNLKTAADALRGEYIVVLTVRDSLANTSAQFKAAFTVE